MSRAFRFTGQPRDYGLLGFTAQPGQVAFFEGQAPDADWEPYVPEAAVSAPLDVPVGEGDPDSDAGSEPDGTDPDVAKDDPAASLKRPAGNASAAEWKAFAAADGGFQEVTGVHPDEATRKDIVEHYTGE